jgi:hypothetical protein
MKNNGTIGKIALAISVTVFLVQLAATNAEVSDLIFRSAPKEATASQSSEVDWWPMFRHDLSHSGFSTSDAPNNNETLWIYETRHQIMSSPTVFEGVVFIGSHDQNLYALNATTGLLIWKYETGGTIFSSKLI